MIILTKTTNQESPIGIYIFLGILAIGLFLIIFFSVRNSSLNKKVSATSSYIKKIREINDSTSFKTISSNYETKTFYLNSKKAFDNFDLHKRIAEFIRDNLNHFEQLVADISFNIETLNSYNKQIKEIPLTSDEAFAKANKMSLKSYREREIKLGYKLAKHPRTSYSLRIKWEYTSPAGRNHYYDYRDFSFSDIKYIVSQFKTTSSFVSHSKENQSNSYTQPRYKQSSQKIYTNDDIEDID